MVDAASETFTFHPVAEKGFCCFTDPATKDYFQKWCVGTGARALAPGPPLAAAATPRTTHARLA